MIVIKHDSGALPSILNTSLWSLRVLMNEKENNMLDRLSSPLSNITLNIRSGLNININTF